MTRFIAAGQAEVLRAAQKDDLQISYVQELLSEIVFKLAGNRTWLKWRSGVQTLGKLVYYGFTTLSNYQTIGEEYTGILQVNKTQRQLPSKMVRTLMVFLDAYGEQAFLRLLQHLESGLKDGTIGSEMTPAARQKLAQMIPVVRTLLPFIHRFHKAVFFVTSSHYHLSKRLTGIHYVLIRPWFASYRTVSGFRLLGMVSMLYLLIHATYSTVILLRNRKPEVAESARSSEMGLSFASAVSRCSLCMEERKNPSSTTCGHLFCWDCIIQWVQSNPRCPMCREEVLPHRIVLLQNYDSS